jgi:hypothetical protein
MPQDAVSGAQGDETFTVTERTAADGQVFVDYNIIAAPYTTLCSITTYNKRLYAILVSACANAYREAVGERVCVELPCRSWGRLKAWVVRELHTLVALVRDAAGLRYAPSSASSATSLRATPHPSRCRSR